MQGQLHFLCRSVDYGLSYSVQYTNPERYVRYGQTLPQADPNGLSATWVGTQDPEDGPPRPIYSEPSLIVSPSQLNHTTSLEQK